MKIVMIIDYEKKSGLKIKRTNFGFVCLTNLRVVLTQGPC